MLEEEERFEQEREEAAERERFKSELEKRKEAAKAEYESLKKARELQKRMGKALLKNAVETRERETKEKATLEQEKTLSEANTSQAKPIKSVTFADATADNGTAYIDWGDVNPGRLEGKRRSSLLTKAQLDQQPMKMRVVERQSGIARSSTTTSAPDRDSDDESDLDSLVAADSDTGDVIPTESYDGRSSSSINPHSDSSDDNQSDTDQEAVEWREEEFNFAQHQREIALAYYEKRATVGTEALSAMRAHSHDETGWDQPVSVGAWSSGGYCVNRFTGSST